MCELHARPCQKIPLQPLEVWPHHPADCLYKVGSTPIKNIPQNIASEIRSGHPSDETDPHIPMSPVMESGKPPMMSEGRSCIPKNESCRSGRYDSSIPGTLAKSVYDGQGEGGVWNLQLMLVGDVQEEMPWRLALG